jgi:hypothetical protein
MIEHTFVIKYTSEGGWEWDTDTEAAHFTDGTIYDTEAGEWQPAHLGEGEYIDNDDEIGEQLVSILAIANDAKGIA